MEIKKKKEKKYIMYRQLCWKCTKTNAIDCSWFEVPNKIYPNRIYPKGVIFDEDGFILKCPNFSPNKKCISKIKVVQKMAEISNKCSRTIARYSEDRRKKDKFNEWKVKAEYILLQEMQKEGVPSYE